MRVDQPRDRVSAVGIDDQVGLLGGRRNGGTDIPDDTA
jgi:hypothetical protein